MTRTRFSTILASLDRARAAGDADAHRAALDELRAALDEPGGRARYVAEFERASEDSVFFAYQREEQIWVK